MTIWLVNASITIDMNDQINKTRKRIITYAKREFLENGYKGASLRRICTNAGVTTGAFYFSFENKEALFRTILQPVIDEAEKKVKALLEREIQDTKTAEENDKLIMEFECNHREEVLILMEKAQGSCYEAIREKVNVALIEAFEQYYVSLLGTTPNRDLIRILVDIRIQSNLVILKGNFDMEYSLYLANAIGIHADGGTAKLIENLRNDAHHNL